MPRQNRTIDGLIQRACKIRKRGCSSSSSSSTILHNHRLKRAILVRKQGVSSTPVPTWKMSSKTAAPMVGLESPRHQSSHNGFKAKQVPVSARKLAATLWEMNEIPQLQEKEELVEKKGKKGKEKMGGSVISGYLPPHLSDPSHSPKSEAGDRSGTGRIRRRMALITQRYGLNERNGGGLDSMRNASLMEIETCSRGISPTGSIVGAKTRFKESSCSLTPSKELLKILNRLWGLEEQQSSSVSLVSALRIELERARVQVDQLIQEQKADRSEINYLMKKIAEEKAAWKSKEEDKIRKAVQSIATHLEVEKKLRKRMECLNKRLTRELAETQASLSKTVKELDSERKDRELMEQVCDELARGIGEDRAEVEELKRESAEVWEEIEKEREMLQLAEVWREERVQMKLSEAKFQLEEKNAALDNLRKELETFLRTKRTKETGGVGKMDEEEEHGRKHPSKSDGIYYQEARGDDDGEDGEDDYDDEEEEGESAESDLHSIELNRDDGSKSYGWSNAFRVLVEDSKISSLEEDLKGRKSYEKKGNGSLDRGFDSRNVENWDDGIAQGRSSMTMSSGPPKNQFSKQDRNEERWKHGSLKGLRDQILAGSRGPNLGFASPTRHWRPSQDSGTVDFDGSKMAEMVKGMRENGTRSKEGRHSRQK